MPLKGRLIPSQGEPQARTAPAAPPSLSDPGRGIEAAEADAPGPRDQGTTERRNAELRRRRRPTEADAEMAGRPGAGAADQVGYSFYSLPSGAFDPHVTVPKLGLTIDRWMEVLYRNNLEVRTRVDVLVELAASMDWIVPRATGQAGDAAYDDFEAWKRSTGFDTWVRQALLDLIVRGEHCSVVADAAQLGVVGTSIALQPLNNRNWRPLWDRHYTVRGIVHSARAPGTYPRSLVPPVADEHLPLESGPVDTVPASGGRAAVSLEVYAEDDILLIRGPRFSHDVHGMPLILSVAKTCDEVEVLHRLRSQMAKRDTHGMLHANVNATGLDDHQGPNGEKSQVDQRIDEVLDLISDQEVVDAVSSDWEIKTRLATWYQETILDPKSGTTSRQGEVELKSLPGSANIAALNEAIREAEAELTTGLRVPEEFLPGTPDSANRALSDNKLVLFQFQLQSLRLPITRELEAKVLPRLGQAGVELTFRRIARPSQGPVAASLIDKLVSVHPDERRGMIAEASGFDIDLRREAPEPPPPPPSPFGAPPGAQREQGDLRRPADRGVEAQGATPVRVPVNPLTSRRRRLMAPRSAKLEAQMKIDVRAALREIADGIAKQGRAAMAKAGLEQADEPPAPDKAAAIRAVNGIEGDPDPLQRVLNDYIRKEYARSRYEIVGLSELPAGAAFKDTSGLDALLAVNETQGAQTITPLGREARDAYVAALAAGDDPEDAEQRLYELFDGYDVDRLVRTEITRASNAARVDQYREAGVKMVRWVTADDDLVDEDCRALERAGPMTLEEAAALQGPPLHPNCRCYLVSEEDWAYITGAPEGAAA